MTRPAPTERVQVPLEFAGGRWAAAVYLAVLAFPESARKRTAFLEDVKAVLVKEAVRSGWAKRNGFKPRTKYTARTTRALEVSGPLVTATRRLERERLPAAAIAEGLLVAAASSGSALRVQARLGGRAVTSLDAGARGLAKAFRRKGWLRVRLDEAEEDFAHNFQRRGWRATRPVLHLAFALRAHLLSKDEAPISLMDLVRAPAWVAPAMRQAEAYRPLFAGASICLAAEDQNLTLPRHGVAP